LSALIRKAHEAKQANATSITLWGTGAPRREFLHVDDCADALVFLLKNYSNNTHINVGSGVDISILALAQLVCEIVGFDGEIVHDVSRPDGTPRKLMDISKLQTAGWTPSIDLKDGIRDTYNWYFAHETSTNK
jgi:GDP-L-fucose synthase